MTLIDLGKIRFNWAGNWSATNNYEADDVVYHEGSAWIAKVSNFGKDPRSNSSTWDRMTKGINYRGNWSTGTVYYNGDLVTNSNALFILTSDAYTSNTAPENDSTNFANLTNGNTFDASQFPSEKGALVVRDSENNVKSVTTKDPVQYRKHWKPYPNDDRSLSIFNDLEPSDFYGGIYPGSQLQMMPHRDDDMGEPTEWTYNTTANGMIGGMDTVNYTTRYTDNTTPMCMLMDGCDNVDTDVVWWRVYKAKRGHSQMRELSLQLGASNQLVAIDEDGSALSYVPIPISLETAALNTRLNWQYLRFDLSHSSLSGVTLGYSDGNGQGGKGGGAFSNIMVNNNNSNYVTGSASSSSLWRVWSFLQGTPGSAGAYLDLAIRMNEDLGAFNSNDHNLHRGFLYQTNNTGRTPLRIDHGRIRMGADFAMSFNEKIVGENAADGGTLNFTDLPYGDANAVALPNSVASGTSVAFGGTFTLSMPYAKREDWLDQSKYFYWNHSSTGNPSGRIEVKKPIMAPAFIKPTQVEIANVSYQSEHGMSSFYLNWYHIPDWQNFRYIQFDMPNLLQSDDGAYNYMRVFYGGNFQTSVNGTEVSSNIYEYSYAYPYESGISYAANTGTSSWQLNRRAGSAGRENATIQARLYGINHGGSIPSDGQEDCPTLHVWGSGHDTADRSRSYIGSGFCRTANGSVLTGVRIYTSGGHWERFTCKVTGFW